MFYLINRSSSSYTVIGVPVEDFGLVSARWSAVTIGISESGVKLVVVAVSRKHVGDICSLVPICYAQ